MIAATADVSISFLSVRPARAIFPSDSTVSSQAATP